MKGPALHFLLIGSLLFAVVEALSAARPARERIEISPARIEELRSQFLAQTGQLPGKAALARLVEEAVDEEVLYREALALGLDHGDPVIRQRLLRNMRFLDQYQGLDDDALYRHARELGMHRTDLVVRRRLTQRMKFRLQAPALAREPSDDELRRLLWRDPTRYERPARVRLRQVFLDRQRRGAAVERDAHRWLEQLRAGTRHGPGDPWLLPMQLSSQSEQELGRYFGAEFARAVMQLEPGGWSGPLRSPYGWHLVFVDAYEPARRRSVSAARSELRHAWRAERGARALAQALAGLRRRYQWGVAEVAR